MTLARWIAVIGLCFATACGGCDDEPKGSNNPASNDPNNGTNNASNNSPNNGTNNQPNNGTNGSNNGTNGSNNGTNGSNNATNGSNNATNNGTGGADGMMCTTDDECQGVCNSAGICVGGGLEDGEMCMEDEQCQGFCDNGTCAGGGTFMPPTNGSGQTLCGNDPCACDNGIDDDGDGLIDGADPECTAAYDDDEGSFATGISGDNKDPKWQDCFFDGNSGAGDDGCRYHTECLTGERPLTDDDCEVAQDCFDFCRPRTPNGCDCFGCCGVDVDGTVEYVQIGADCSIADIDNCVSCVQQTECLNECGECELCLGKTIDDLPEVCSSGGDGNTCVDDDDCLGMCVNGTCSGGGDDGGDDGGIICEDGEPACPNGQSDCPAQSSGTAYYCLQGCCLAIAQ